MRSRAGIAWHLFLKMHALLRIPLKGNPLDPASKDLAGKKFLPPSTNNRFLGEMVSIGRLPCSISPTARRQESGLFLINEVKRSGRFHQGDAASLFQKLRFLMSAVHGRCGLPALQPIAARQNEDRSDVTLALASAFEWLPELLLGAGPREWPWRQDAPTPLHIFGDASEPGERTGGPPMLAAVIRLPGGALRAFHTRVPQAVIAALPPRAKKIYFYELLWPVLAAYIWKDLLGKAYPVYYEDNTAAQHNLLNGFSSCFAPSLFLALFWGRRRGTEIASLDRPRHIS